MNTSTSVKHAAVSKKLKKGILPSLPFYLCMCINFYIPFILFQLIEPVHNVLIMYEQFCPGMVVQLARLKLYMYRSTAVRVQALPYCCFPRQE